MAPDLPDIHYSVWRDGPQWQWHVTKASTLVVGAGAAETDIKARCAALEFTIRYVDDELDKISNEGWTAPRSSTVGSPGEPTMGELHDDVRSRVMELIRAAEAIDDIEEKARLLKQAQDLLMDLTVREQPPA